MFMCTELARSLINRSVFSGRFLRMPGYSALSWRTCDWTLLKDCLKVHDSALLRQNTVPPKHDIQQERRSTALIKILIISPIDQTNE